jgi:hypothetical protein
VAERRGARAPVRAQALWIPGSAARPRNDARLSKPHSPFRPLGPRRRHAKAHRMPAPPCLCHSGAAQRNPESRVVTVAERRGARASVRGRRRSGFRFRCAAPESRVTRASRIGTDAEDVGLEACAPPPSSSRNAASSVARGHVSGIHASAQVIERDDGEGPTGGASVPSSPPTSAEAWIPGLRLRFAPASPGMTTMKEGRRKGEAGGRNGGAGRCNAPPDARPRLRHRRCCT